jgi:hypothetical protein
VFVAAGITETENCAKSNNAVPKSPSLTNNHPLHCRRRIHLQPLNRNEKFFGNPDVTQSGKTRILCKIYFSVFKRHTCILADRVKCGYGIKYTFRLS